MIPDYVRAKAVSNPLRLKIIMAFKNNNEMSVQGLSKALNIQHGKVYYHVKKLLEAELLEEASHREINGIVERFFKLKEENLKIELDKSKREIGLSLVKNMILEVLNNNCEKGNKVMFSVGEIYLSEDEMKEFKRKFESFIDAHKEEKKDTQKIVIAPLIITKENNME